MSIAAGETFTIVPNRILQSENGVLDIYDIGIYSIIKSHCYGEKNWCCPGEKRIAKMASCSVRRVIKSIAKLEKLGLIHKRRLGYGKQNEYILCDTADPKIQELLPISEYGAHHL